MQKGKVYCKTINNQAVVQNLTDGLKQWLIKHKRVINTRIYKKGEYWNSASLKAKLAENKGKRGSIYTRRRERDQIEQVRHIRADVGDHIGGKADTDQEETGPKRRQKIIKQKQHKTEHKNKENK